MMYSGRGRAECSERRATSSAAASSADGYRPPGPERMKSTSGMLGGRVSACRTSGCESSGKMSRYLACQLKPTLRAAMLFITGGLGPKLE